MQSQITVRVGEWGNIVVPAKVRGRLDLRKGSRLVLIEEDASEVRIDPLPHLLGQNRQALLVIAQGRLKEPGGDPRFSRHTHASSLNHAATGQVLHLCRQNIG